VTEPIIIKAIPAGLQVVTNARLTVEGQNCQVATNNGLLTANLSVIVEGMLQIAGQQIIAPDGNGGTLITFDGEIPANSTLTFTVIALTKDHVRESVNKYEMQPARSMPTANLTSGASTQERRGFPGPAGPSA
jgi:hypothetical protein